MGTTSVISAVPAVVFVTYVSPLNEITTTRAYYVVVGVVSLAFVIAVYAILVVTYVTIKKNIRKRIQWRRYSLYCIKTF